MRKTILSLLLVFGLMPMQADEYEYLWLHSPAASATSFYAIDDLRKITFGDDAMQFYLKSLSSPVTWTYANLLKMTFETTPVAVDIKSLQKPSGLSITLSLPTVHIESHSPLKSVAIYNLQGSRLAIFGQGETSISYSLHTLPKGVYIVRAENTERSQTIKFVKH